MPFFDPEFPDEPQCIDPEINVENNQLIESITKKCNNLTDFEFYSDYMSEENRNNFIEKFGSKLISVKFKKCRKPEAFLSSMKINNIEKLVINRMTLELSRIYFS